MNPALHAHIKHILIAILLVGGALLALKLRGEYEVRQAQILADRDKQIAANQATVANAQKTVENAQQANRSIDDETRAKLATLAAQISSKPDSATIRAIVEASLPGVKTVSGTDSSGNPIVGVADTQASRDAINLATTNAKICNVNLGDCQVKQANLQTIITAQNTELGADKDTIALQMKQINQLSKYQVPRWTLMMGAGKTQGTSFQDVSNYQPVIGLDYRLTSRFGIFGLAQNKSAAAGISWHFGAIR